jgi:signal transduction histidine kinase
MPDPDLKHFRVSAGLKNIIGNELITDDFVAVFELVKNSFDAHAKNVVVRFENLRQPNPNRASLIIKDDGKGMTRKDLGEKWLFVAYSAKKHETEDVDLEQNRDYRHLIGAGRPFAGAKGIGRFSCDRLGRYLTVYTRRDPNQPQFEWLKVDWRDFEADDKKRFEEVEIWNGEAEKDRFKLERGTVLKISGLRKIWTRQDLIALRKELQKLVDPEDAADRPTFTITIEAPEEALHDRNEKNADERVNGPIRNFLFERLKLKTTELFCRISASGKTIETELLDHSKRIYRVVESNSQYPDLAGVTFRVYYLNRAAKMSFRKTMGVAPIEFGSLFVYKNGFRVQPYGREDDDSFYIDRRKVQGTARYLGNRDLIGRIEIRCDKSRFKEASSRNAGFIESAELDQLTAYVLVIIRRLEAFVVDVIRWGNPPGKGVADADSPTAADNRDAMLALVERMTDSKEIVNFEVGKDLLKVVTERQAQGAAALLANFERLATQHADPKLASEAKRIRREMDAVLSAREQAEKEAREERNQRVLNEKQVALERQRNQVLTDLVKPADEQKLVLTHWVKIVAGSIMQKASNIIPLLHGRPDQASLDKAVASLIELKTEAEKLQKATSLIDSAGFADMEDAKERNLARFFWEYVDHEKPFAPRLRHEVRWDPDAEFEYLFRPLDLAVVIDNLCSNARKSGAGLMRWEVTRVPSLLHVRVANDGAPMRKEFVDSLFSLGASSTRGTGIGLYTCRLLLNRIGAEIVFAGNDSLMGGAAFELSFPA